MWFINRFSCFCCENLFFFFSSSQRAASRGIASAVERLGAITRTMRKVIDHSPVTQICGYFMRVCVCLKMGRKREGDEAPGDALSHVQ